VLFIIIVLGFAAFIGFSTSHAEAKDETSYSVLAIQYVGPLDKPIDPIVISDSRAGAEWYRTAVLERGDVALTYEHAVSRALFEKLTVEVESYKGETQQGLEKKSAPLKQSR